MCVGAFGAHFATNVFTHIKYTTTRPLSPFTRRIFYFLLFFHFPLFTAFIRFDETSDTHTHILSFKMENCNCQSIPRVFKIELRQCVTCATRCHERIDSVRSFVRFIDQLWMHPIVARTFLQSTSWQPLQRCSCGMARCIRCSPLILFTSIKHTFVQPSNCYIIITISFIHFMCSCCWRCRQWQKIIFYQNGNWRHGTRYCRISLMRMQCDGVVQRQRWAVGGSVWDANQTATFGWRRPTTTAYLIVAI